MVSSYKGGIVTGRRTIIETVPGYSFCGVYTVLVSRRPPEEIGVNAPGYSISGGGYTSRTVGPQQLHTLQPFAIEQGGQWGK